MLSFWQETARTRLQLGVVADPLAPARGLLVVVEVYGNTGLLVDRCGVHVDDGDPEGVLHIIEACVFSWVNDERPRGVLSAARRAAREWRRGLDS